MRNADIPTGRVCHLCHHAYKDGAKGYDKDTRRCVKRGPCVGRIARSLDRRQLFGRGRPDQRGANWQTGEYNRVMATQREAITA